MTKYNKNRGKELLEYMTSREPYYEQEDWRYNKLQGMKKVANPPPLFSGWCTQIGITKETLSQWTKTKPEFKECHALAKSYQEYFLVTNALLGLYSDSFTRFFLKNNCGYTEKDVIEIVDNKKGISDEVLKEINKKIGLDYDK